MEINNIIPVLLGFIFIILSFVLKRKNKKLEETGETTEGVVFDFETDSSSSTTFTKYSVIRFATKENVWVTKTVNVGTTFSGFKKGDKVTIVYDNTNPENFMIKHASTYLIINIFLIIGILSTVLGLFMLAKNAGL